MEETSDCSKEQAAFPKLRHAFSKASTVVVLCLLLYSLFLSIQCLKKDWSREEETAACVEASLGEKGVRGGRLVQRRREDDAVRVVVRVNGIDRRADQRLCRLSLVPRQQRQRDVGQAVTSPYHESLQTGSTARWALPLPPQHCATQPLASRVNQGVTFVFPGLTQESFSRFYLC